MYGVIQDSVKALVLERFGESTWEAILEHAGLPNDQIVLHEFYEDEIVVKVVLSAAAKLGVDAGDVLRLYGDFFLSYLRSQGHEKLLRILGSTLQDFLYNLDYLHAHLQDAFPQASFPHFHTVQLESGRFHLNYESSRGSLLAPFVEGLVGVIAKDLFDTPVDIKIVSTNECGAVFEIKYLQGQDSVVSERSKVRLECGLKVASSEPVALGPAEITPLPAYDRSESSPYSEAATVLSDAVHLDFFLQQWPFFVLMSEDLRILAVGPSLADRLPDSVIGLLFHEVFDVQRPVGAKRGEAQQFVNHSNSTFKVVSRKNIVSTSRPLVLRGAMNPLGTHKGFLFLCSAHMLSIDDMLDAGMHMNDFPLHDSGRDLLFMAEHRKVESGLLLRLERLSAELADEQRRSDDLLFSMLPEGIVEDLLEGNRARAEQHEAITILFSDIVGFTDISATCKPQQVCNMLDELYTVFDTITTFFDIYKVETIGDAYMAAGGIVGDTSKHATMVADFAFAMHAGAKLIRAPNTGQPLDIRVGMHSGPAMTGVVGVKMPRFCFFGDTVNTASRMESNGHKGQSHCSAQAAQLLAEAGYGLESRGSIPIKGKGVMETFWLRRHPRERRETIKAALKAAKKKLAELLLLREGDDTTSGDDELSKRERQEKKQLGLWDQGRARRGQHLDPQDTKVVSQIKRTLSHNQSTRGPSSSSSSSDDDDADSITSALLAPSPETSFTAPPVLTSSSSCGHLPSSAMMAPDSAASDREHLDGDPAPHRSLSAHTGAPPHPRGKLKRSSTTGSALNSLAPAADGKSQPPSFRSFRRLRRQSSVMAAELAASQPATPTFHFRRNRSAEASLPGLTLAPSPASSSGSVRREGWKAAWQEQDDGGGEASWPLARIQSAGSSDRLTVDDAPWSLVDEAWPPPSLEADGCAAPAIPPPPPEPPALSAAGSAVVGGLRGAEAAGSCSTCDASCMSPAAASPQARKELEEEHLVSASLLFSDSAPTSPTEDEPSREAEGRRRAALMMEEWRQLKADGATLSGSCPFGFDKLARSAPSRPPPPQPEASERRPEASAEGEAKGRDAAEAGGAPHVEFSFSVGGTEVQVLDDANLSALNAIPQCVHLVTYKESPPRSLWANRTYLERVGCTLSELVDGKVNPHGHSTASTAEWQHRYQAVEVNGGQVSVHEVIPSNAHAAAVAVHTVCSPAMVVPRGASAPVTCCMLTHSPAPEQREPTAAALYDKIMAERSPHPLCLFTMEGQLISANPAARAELGAGAGGILLTREVFGMSERECQTLHDHAASSLSWLAAERRAAYQSMLAALTVCGSSHEVDVPVLKKSGAHNKEAIWICRVYAQRLQDAVTGGPMLLVTRQDVVELQTPVGDVDRIELALKATEQLDHCDRGSEEAVVVMAQDEQLLAADGDQDWSACLQTASSPAARSAHSHTAEESSLRKCLESADGWDFDAFELEHKTREKPLQVLGWYVFSQHRLIEEFDLDAARLARFLRRMEDGHPRTNPYHNSTHVADVLHSMHCLLRLGGLDRWLGRIDVLSALLAATVHDFEHKGVNNDFLIQTQHAYALDSNDISPNEHHHLSASLKILASEECNFMHRMPLHRQRAVRKTVIDMVLATDMGQHTVVLAALKSTLQQRLQDPLDTLHGGGEAEAAVRTLMLQGAMKVADMGHLHARQDVHVRWSQRLQEEMFGQGDAEKELGLKVSYLMDRDGVGVTQTQTGFIDFVCRPLLQAWATCLPQCRVLVDRLDANYAYWKAKTTCEAAQ